MLILCVFVEKNTRYKRHELFFVYLETANITKPRWGMDTFFSHFQKNCMDEIPEGGLLPKAEQFGSWELRYFWGAECQHHPKSLI